jgi:Rrf2 family protein
MLSNTHFSIAVHVLSALAYNDGVLLGSEDLARTVGSNPSFIRGLIGRLKEAGLVETQLGKGGGARLGRPASKITLCDVYRATESKPALKTHSCEAGASVCIVAAKMTPLLAEIGGRIEHAVEGELKRTTIAELVRKID